MKDANEPDRDIRSHYVFRMSLFTTIKDRGCKQGFFDTFGITLREYRILAVLAYLQPAPLNALVEECFLDKGQVSRNVSKLFQAGLIERVRDGKAAQRGGELRLSPKGRAVYRVAMEQGDALNDLVMTGISDEDRAVFSRVLDQMLDTARAEFDGS